MVQKVINGWLIVDVNKGTMRVLKKVGKGKTRIKGTEVAIELKLDVEIPEEPILKAEGKIILGKTQIKNLIIEQLAEGDNDDN